jgi:hypothetical protein
VRLLCRPIASHCSCSAFWRPADPPPAPVLRRVMTIPDKSRRAAQAFRQPSLRRLIPCALIVGTGPWKTRQACNHASADGTPADIVPAFPIVRSRQRHMLPKHPMKYLHAVMMSCSWRSFGATLRQATVRPAMHRSGARNLQQALDARGAPRRRSQPWRA